LSFGVAGRSASIGSLSRLLDGSAAASPERGFATNDLSNTQFTRLAARSDRTGSAGDGAVAFPAGNANVVAFDRTDGYPATDRPKQTAQADTRTPPRSFADVALPPGVGVFASGEIGLGTQSGSRTLSSFEYYLVSLSAGVDYRFNENVVLGIGAGYSNSSSNIVGGSTTSGEEYNAVLYGTWIPIKRLYLEGIVDIGSISLDSKRAIPVSGFGTALGSRTGRDFSASLTAGYDFVSGAWVLNPYLRVNSVSINLDSFAETGAGAANLSFRQQSANALEAVAAFRLAYRWQTANGSLIVPYVRGEYMHNYNGGRQSALVNFVTAPALTPFVVPVIGLHSDTIALGAGVQANLQQGLSLQAAYQTLLGVTDQSEHRFLVGLSQRF
jgi:outer membrane autotransporter protein